MVVVTGDVDHGKTALVQVLTGMETDWLAEEKRRGISITLGVAHLRMAGVTIDLIEMPGHERFVRTMDSGERWLGKFGQVAKWIVCLNAARIPRIRSKNDQASTPEPQSGFQGEGGVGGHQGREDAG